MSSTPNLVSRIRGCLLAGAVGDALGAPVEFWSIDQIARRCGADGVRKYLPADFGNTAGTGLVTDDTQMTLFTLEGIIRAYIRSTQRGICHPPSVVHHAYQRWLTTQLVVAPPGTTDFDDPLRMDGWLGQQHWLYSRRAPGNTCLSALEATRHRGFGDPATNNSKGCGAVMRTAPFGLAALNDPAGMAVECAALTHGHPTGQISSGAFAIIIDALMDGRPLDLAAEAGRAWANDQKDGAETVGALDRAIAAVEEDAPSWNVVASLGEGWVAEEALAIAVYSALAFREPTQFLNALSLAVTHSGDSDSTGAICGNILGALHGEEVIPVELLSELEGRDTISALASDLATLIEHPDAATTGVSGIETIMDTQWLTRYPGW